MKIGVISDTHGSLSAWQEAYYNFFKDADLIIHCGDVLYHGPRNPLPDGYDPAGLAKAINQSTLPIIFARGNCDAEVDQILIDYPLESPYAHLISPELNILIHHGHLYTQDLLPQKVTGIYPLIISGHTHIPGITGQPGSILLNPGSPALPKNETKKPTIALIENRLLKIINLNNGEVYQQREL